MVFEKNTTGEKNLFIPSLLYSTTKYRGSVLPGTLVHKMWWYPDLLNSTTKYSGTKYLVIPRPTIYTVVATNGSLRPHGSQIVIRAHGLTNLGDQ